MQIWKSRARSISSLDPSWKTKAREHLSNQTRPEGSLGLLESILERLVAIQKKDRPSTNHKRIFVFASDHGVTEEGVSLYPRSVTASMVKNFLSGGATINALAKNIGAEVVVIDIGVDADFDDDRLVHAKMARGTRNLAREPAMTAEDLDRALEVGWKLVEKAKSEGVELVGLGEMGIGNTTAASAMIAALLGTDAASVTGRGTGLGDAALKHKVQVIERALSLHRNSLQDPLDALRCVGGFELAGMTGAILAAATLGIPVVIDGWIVSASALVAIRLNPNVADYLFFAHQSEERGHRLLLDRLEVHPMLNLSMHLGEASGAALAMGILDSAVRVYNEVATFEEAVVARRGP